MSVFSEVIFQVFFFRNSVISIKCYCVGQCPTESDMSLLFSHCAASPMFKAVSMRVVVPGNAENTKVKSVLYAMESARCVGKTSGPGQTFCLVMGVRFWRRNTNIVHSIFSLTRLKCSGHLLFRSLTLHLRTNFERVLYDPHNFHIRYSLTIWAIQPLFFRQFTFLFFRLSLAWRPTWDPGLENLCPNYQSTGLVCMM
jgi:hypothetical protein